MLLFTTNVVPVVVYLGFSRPANNYGWQSESDDMDMESIQARRQMLVGDLHSYQM